MKELWRIFTVFLGLAAHSLSSAAKDVVDTNAVISCAISGYHADGTKIKTRGAEEIRIEIKRINWNANEPSKPPAWGSMSNIKVKSTNKFYEASLLKSTKDRVAFSFANDVEIDKTSQTLAFIYEVSLDTLKIKRTVLTLFSTAANLVLSSEGDCTRKSPNK